MEEKKRGRPPKKATTEQQQTIQEFADLMSSPQFTMNFATKISSDVHKLDGLTASLGHTGSYNPVWSEQLQQDIVFKSLPATSDDVAEWLKSPAEYSDNLRSLSQYLENAISQYGRAVSLMSDIKSYNYDLRCATPDLASKINSPSFTTNYNKALSVLRKLNISYQIKRLDRKVMQDGVAFVWFNEHKDGIDFLDLPTDFCYITSSWSYGYLFAIDLTYFDRFAWNQQQVPELSQAYKVFCEKRKNLANGEKLEPYQYFGVSPDQGWCCLYDPNRPLKTPPLIGAAIGAIDALSYRNLIKQKALIDLWRVLAFQIPMDEKTGKMQISYQEATGIINSIRSVLPENFIAFASPFDVEAPINADQTNVMSTLEDVSNKSFYDYSAIPNALFNTDLKSDGALKLATNSFFAYASVGVYEGMQNLINWILRMKCGSEFDWHVYFYGNKLMEAQERTDALKLFTSGNAPAGYVMSHFGFEPFDLNNAYLIENKLGIKENMKPLILSNQLSAATEEAGRPADEELPTDDSEK